MAQTRRMGKRNQRQSRPKAPRPPTQTSARPSLKGLLTERRGRDVGFAKSGFRPTAMGNSAFPVSPSLLKLTQMGSSRTATKNQIDNGPAGGVLWKRQMSEYNLSGKTAIITGASKGLGKAMALALGSAGANIALVSRDIEQLNGVKQAVDSVGGKAQVFPA